MIRARHFPIALAAAALAACSTAPTQSTYYTPGAPPVAVAGSTATYSAGTGTLASGVNKNTTSDRLSVGEGTTAVPTNTAPTGSLVGGSALNNNPNTGTTSAPAVATPPAR
jgi:X-X-X-Leu-X-X-Gly heptad repeat protein